VNVIDFYLDDAREKERLEIIRLSQTNDKESTELLHGYVREAMSAHDSIIFSVPCCSLLITGLRPQFTGLWREARVDADVPQGPGLPNLKVKAGDRLRGSFKNAHINVSP
jgi:linoleate 10R-lipoxygenase